MTGAGGFLGVLMLDTAFPRIPGDAGHPGSYHMPARLRVVEGAGSLEVVRDGPLPDALVLKFVDAARELERDGAIAIVSTCGFLVTVQPRIAAAVRVPVMLSALSLFPLVRLAHGGRPIGVLTASAAALGGSALTAAGIDAGQARIAGMEHCAAFAGAILRPKSGQPGSLDQDAIRDAAVAGAQGLRAKTPDLGAILLECGNLPPYAEDIASATGLPVYSILDAARLLTGARHGV